MPITLTASGMPWAKLKVTTLKMAFNADGQTAEVDLKGLQLAADPENSVPGWLRIDDNSRDFVAAKLNQPPPKAPTDKHVWTVGLLLYSPKAMGDTVYEICDTSLAYRKFAEQVFNRAEPEFGKGAIPLVKIVDTPVIPTTNGSTTRILFEIEKWIQRPDAFLEAVRLRDSTGPSDKSYAEASGRDPAAVSPQRDLDDEILF